MLQKRPYVIMPTCRHDSTKDNRSVGHPKKNLWWCLSFRGTIFPPVFRIFGFPQQNPPVFRWDLRISFWGGNRDLINPSIFRGYSLVFMGGLDLFFVATKPTSSNRFVVFVSWLVRIDPARWAEFLKPPHLLLGQVWPHHVRPCISFHLQNCPQTLCQLIVHYWYGMVVWDSSGTAK